MYLWTSSGGFSDSLAPRNSITASTNRTTDGTRGCLKSPPPAILGKSTFSSPEPLSRPLAARERQRVRKQISCACRIDSLVVLQCYFRSNPAKITLPATLLSRFLSWNHWVFLSWGSLDILRVSYTSASPRAERHPSALVAASVETSRLLVFPRSIYEPCPFPQALQSHHRAFIPHIRAGISPGGRVAWPRWPGQGMQNDTQRPTGPHPGSLLCLE